MAARKRREPDPPDVLRELESELTRGELRRGYVLRGEERYFHERAIELLRARGEAAGFETVTHDATKGNPDFRLSGLVGDLSGGGLFHDRRLVIVRHCEEPLKKVDGGKSPLTEAIERFVQSPEDPGCLVLSAGSLRVDHAAVKALVAQGGAVLGFRKLWDSPPPWNPDPRQAELVRWVQQRADKLGLRLDARQAVFVCAATGNDLFALDDQLERLRTSGGGSLSDVIGWDATSAPWDVAEALVGGDVPRALAGVQTLYRGGFHERSGRRTTDPAALTAILIGSVARGVRQNLRIARDIEQGLDPEEAVQRAQPGGRPNNRGALIQRARARPAREWASMFADVQALEGRAKSGSSPDADDFSQLALRWARA